MIQEAVDAYTEQTGVKVDLQFKGRTGNREALQPALDGGTQIDIFDEDIDRVNGMYGKYLLDLEDLAKENDYEATANAGLMAACRDAGGGTLKTIPYQPNVFAFFYNKDLFEQAGITEEPKTWDEFKDVCQKLKDAGLKVNGMILQFFRWHRISKTLHLTDIIQRWLVPTYGLQVRTQSLHLEQLQCI